MKKMIECDDGYDEFCQAFNELYGTIKDLRKLENNAKEMNRVTLEKCKKEIEDLLGGEKGEIGS